jgi:DNA-binding CsgD family transcriptional regulator/tetratricopeptide (TPR) repeat protein
MPALVIATCRESELDPGHPVWSLWEDAVRNRFGHMVRLRPLSFGDVRSMLRALNGRLPPDATVRAVVKVTDGNPFFVEEVYADQQAAGGSELLGPSGEWREVPHDWTPGLPETVRLVVSRRLSRLSGDTLRVLEAAALLGKAFQSSLIEAADILEGEDLSGALEEAQVAKVILCAATGSEPSYTFAHEFIRQGVLERISAPRRQRLHLRLADAMERVWGERLTEHAAEIATQLRSAGRAANLDVTLWYLGEAGRHALATAAYEEAVRHGREALKLIDERGERLSAERCDVLIRLGEAQARAGALGSARRSFLDAMALARHLKDTGRLARTALGFSEHTSAGDLIDEVAGQLLDEAMAALQAEGGQDTLLALLKARRALSLAWANEADRMLRLSEEALDLARRQSDRSALAWALEARHRALATPDRLSERLQVAAEMVRIADDSGDPLLGLEGRLLYLTDLLEHGDADLAGREVETFGRLAEQVNMPLYRWHHLNLRVTMALVFGAFAEAERLAGEALALGRANEIETAHHLFLAQMFGIRREQGRLEEVLPPLEALADALPAMPAWRCVLAYAYSETRRERACRAEVAALAVDAFTGLPRDAGWLSGVAFLSHACWFLRDRERAAMLYDLLLPYAGQNVVVVGTGLYSGPVSLYLGLLASSLGQPGRALQWFEDAWAEAERIGAKPFAARAQMELARALLARGRRRDMYRAKASLEGACRLFEELGMDGHLARGRALLERPHVASAEPPRTYPDGLTAREVEVLRLIAAGLTNSEIAARLVVSVRTVGRHVTNIYTKIGARNRAEATAYAVRGDLTQIPELR